MTRATKRLRTLPLIAVGLLACGSEPANVAPGFDLQGHRGARALVPENTLPSFERALDLEVDTLELDLHWSADEALIVWHDPIVAPGKCRIDPRSDAPRPPDPASTPPARRAVRALHSEQLRRYRCDGNPDPERFPEQQPAPGVVAGNDFAIVTLADVFELVERYAADPRKSDAQRRNAARVRFNVESKRDPEYPGNIGDDFDGENAGPFERALQRLVRERGLEDRVTLQSFDHRSLRAMRALDPDIELVALSEGEADPQELAAFGAAVWSPWHEAVTPDSLAAAHAAGLRVVPWTVNDPDRARELAAMGVDGFITDAPDRVRGQAR